MRNLIDSVSARVEVSEMATALPLYKALSGVDEPAVLEFPAVKVAVVGPFLLMEGDAAVLERLRRAATLHVNDLDAAVGAFVGADGEVLDGPAASGGGTRTIVRDRDGNVFECFQKDSAE
ncbi:VOC family protein [Streptomyces sp. GbtcB6]|uniref:VOC family protein n=1 Tax=Streptomyces sp. GbtcB6 TaxID=2824751 RepID=UPI001C2F11AC|nr:VOC family protein [Streptomyces sp. GbtcB6]